MHNVDDEHQNNQDQLEQVAKRLAGKTTINTSGDLDLLASVGGFRGIAEAVVPALVFLTAFIITTDVWPSAVLAVAVALLASVLRIIQKQPVVQAIAGAIGVMICAVVALLQDDAGGYFVPGFYISGIYGLAFLISLLVKWPIMGLIFGWIRGEGLSWQKDPARRRKYQLATFLMVAVFIARLAVQLPLYWSDQEVLLGVMRLLMGVPLYAVVLWFGWLITKPAKTSHMTRHQFSSDTDTPSESGTEPKL